MIPWTTTRCNAIARHCVGAHRMRPPARQAPLRREPGMRREMRARNEDGRMTTRLPPICLGGKHFIGYQEYAAPTTTDSDSGGETGTPAAPAAGPGGRGWRPRLLGRARPLRADRPLRRVPLAHPSGHLVLAPRPPPALSRRPRPPEYLPSGPHASNYARLLFDDDKMLFPRTRSAERPDETPGAASVHRATLRRPLTCLGSLSVISSASVFLCGRSRLSSQGGGAGG